MSTQSEISKRIQELAESNRRRDESAKKAEEKMASGEVTSEPVVEQVMPKPKKGKKSVTVQKKREGEPATGEIMEEPAKQPAASENEPAETPKPDPQLKQKEKRATLKQSLEDFERLMEEESPKKATRNTIVSPSPAEEQPEEEAVEVKKVKTTVKSSPRDKGFHAVHRHKVSQPQLTEKEEEVYCLLDPLTGELNTIVRDVTVIGKSSMSNIVIDNRFVSRTHARLLKKEDGIYIEDIGTDGTGSTNGTKVNGVKIKSCEPVKLEPGDNIQLAQNATLIFNILK